MSQPNRGVFKELLAVSLAAVAGFVGIFLMLTGEKAVMIPANALAQAGANPQMLGGLMAYSQGIGVILLCVGVAYILLGYKEDLTTSPSRPADTDD